MAAHYGIAIIPDAHKNALNAVYAVWQNEDPTLSENLSQPLNATGDINDPVTHWMGGRLYNDADLAVIQALATHMPTVSWPVVGVSGNVSEAQANAAAAALYTMVGTATTYSTPLAQQTLEAALGALGLRRVVEE